MFRWMPYAMVRIMIFFASGILLAIGLPDLLSTTIALITAASLVAVYVLLAWIKVNNSLRGFIGLTSVVFVSYAHVQIHVARHDPTNFINEPLPVGAYEARLIRYSEEKENSWKAEAEVLHVRVNDHWKESSGKILLYFAKTDFEQPFGYGDRLLINATPTIVRAPANPGVFDMQRYLYFKNIYHQQYLRKSDVTYIGHQPGSYFVAAAINVRLWSDLQLHKFVNGPREQATASALVLGVTDGLDSDLLQAYASTGAMHVLAVSGLHVSIIYWIILLIGKPLEKLKSGKWILAIGSLVLLWIYAFITGWSPSVLRAVMMFTFVALARPWKQSTNIYNTMASSAFCLLLYDPFFLMSVGFQLSYIAVFGIIFLHPHLYRLYEPNSRILDEIWKVTSVSITAQIATFPIGLYYFHQFPNYFLLANLLVIPASFVVLVAGLAVLPLSIVPVLATIVGFILQWTIWLMNSIIFIIGSLPFSTISSINISPLQAWFMVVIILGICFCLIYRSIRWLWVSLSFALLFSVADWFHLTYVVNRNHLVIYQVPGKTAIDFIQKGQLFVFGDSSVVHDPKIASFHMAANRIRLGCRIRGNSAVIEESGVSVVKLSDKRVLIVGSDVSQIPANSRADLIVITGNSVRSVASLLEKVQCEIIVIDSSNSFYFADKLMNEKVPGRVRIHSVLHDGAFIYSY